MGLSDFFILMLVVTAIVVGGRMFFHDLSDVYDVPRTENFTAFDAYMNDTYEEIEDIESRIEGSEVTGIDAIDLAIYFVRGSYHALMLTLRIPTLYSGLITESITLLNLPVWVKTMLLGIITVTVVFMIISVAMKYRV